MKPDCRHVIRGLPLELAMTPGELVMYSILRGGELGLNCSLRRALKALLQKGAPSGRKKRAPIPRSRFPSLALTNSIVMMYL